jgi:hypothetical protein
MATTPVMNDHKSNLLATIAAKEATVGVIGPERVAKS